MVAQITVRTWGVNYVYCIYTRHLSTASNLKTFFIKDLIFVCMCTTFLTYQKIVSTICSREIDKETKRDMEL